MNEKCVVMTTFSDGAIGEKIIHSLIEKRLAACVQVQSIESYYHWQGKVAKDQEKLVIIKTTSALYAQVEADILANHDYETPEIIQLPITAGYRDYLQWIESECRNT
ncbi:divalent-cation tolerance protein CutA [Photobacterium sp. DNB23_23_1]|uniref:Divalent-cation tolerance protein CutA n=1 Tax=Photobacterium pectinilyticum TaxID=2906793 RepID=A0ABT1N276_9GAMM|nr:divalent-cation tolerance protein CutA [Photobacterium sp. ZSDE20]MCQ1058835.1 divalent-cation tolerance protein CutA [Photobacterium sp. ZSDE20]MDD1823875.1 divalent-cation tolerance protein CutA [Photobacterium sp. ZSDE20]